MTRQNFITGYSAIHNNKIWLNTECIFEMKEAPAGDFLNSAYEWLNPGYPKFFKMDNLCKTGFLATECLLKSSVEKFQPERTGIVISTSHSSLDTDMRFYESMASAPSPALFVYTLPNILIGEISIRHQIKGESACFVFDIFDYAFQAEYINGLMNAGRIDTCMSGWVDFYDGKMEAFMYLVENTDEKNYLIHDSHNTGKIYREIWKP